MEKKTENKAYAHAEKAYMQGTMYPFVRVGMQKVNLAPTVEVVNGERIVTPNAPFMTPAAPSATPMWKST